MLILRSQMTESSSAECSVWSPPGNLVSGHSLTVCNIVCLLPQAQSGSSRMPQSWRVEAHRPWPVRKWLRSDQSLCSRSKPGWHTTGSLIRDWLGISFLSQSAFQALSIDQSGWSTVDYIGLLDGNRASGWAITSSNMVGSDVAGFCP